MHEVPEDFAVRGDADNRRTLAWRTLAWRTLAWRTLAMKIIKYDKGEDRIVISVAFDDGVKEYVSGEDHDTDYWYRVPDFVELGDVSCIQRALREFLAHEAYFKETV